MDSDKLTLTFSALADPTRRAILARLSQGEATVAELSQPFLQMMSPPAITKHLHVLEKAGLISRGRQAQWRPCKINGESFREVSDWLNYYRQFWEESLDRLDIYLKSITCKSSTIRQEKKNEEKFKINSQRKQKTKKKEKRDGSKK